MKEKKGEGKDEGRGGKVSLPPSKNFGYGLASEHFFACSCVQRRGKWGTAACAPPPTSTEGAMSLQLIVRDFYTCAYTCA